MSAYISRSGDFLGNNYNAMTDYFTSLRMRTSVIMILTTHPHSPGDTELQRHKRGK